MRKPKVFKVDKTKINRLKLSSIILGLLVVGSIASLIMGVGPLARFFATKPSINETKTICTRKLNGDKDCTTWETETVNGVKTTTTTAQIIADKAGVDKVVKYEYEVVKTAPVDSRGVQTGSSTTIEVRKNVDPDTGEKEVLSTVKTVQKAPVVDTTGKPIAPGEVVSEVRTGDISLGVTSYKSGDRDKKEKCEEAGKEWKNDSCQKKDDRTAEQKCTQDESGKANGNSWANGACIMKVEPRVVSPASTSSTGVNCDKGTCQTSGSPICYGSYASTGQYTKDANGNPTGDYDCRLCGDNGSGGVGFTGGAQSCKALLAQNAPVVLGFSANPAGLGLPAGTQTGSCMSKRGADWVLAAVGQSGEGPNEGKYCDVTGGWVSAPPKIMPPTANNAPKTPEAQCHAQHPGYIYGKNFDGEYVCVPRNNINLAMMGNQDPCKAGKGSIEGKEVWIECSGLGTVKNYTFCYGGTGTFDEKGVCSPPSNASTNDLIIGGTVKLAGNGFGLGVTDEGKLSGTASLNTKPIIGSAVGCLSGAVLGLWGGPIGMIGGCTAGAAAAGAGAIIGGNSEVSGELFGTGAAIIVDNNGNLSGNAKLDTKPIIGGVIGCVSGGLAGLVAGPIGAIGGCTAGAAASVGGVIYGSTKPDESNQIMESTSEPQDDNTVTNTRLGISAAGGCAIGATAGILLGPIGAVGGCVVGGGSALAGYAFSGQ